ncbi:hypothetical protein ACFR9U_05875 [Halorientalis brevis]|uniref:Uncharacterized protein n=1 Tax=Halorientalis brevis TaxID=1126241 RepID=A0ABD6C9W8_9EURY|nr:hypothetical protein [Halorientalis brevis]
MEQETSPIDGQLGEERMVVAAFDEAATGREFIIADISHDGSWISVAADDAVSLRAHL